MVSIGLLTAFIQYAQRFFRPIQDFSEKYNILQSAMAASERVFKLLDTPAEIVSPAVTKTPTGPGRIEFDHVWFAYRDRTGRASEHASASELEDKSSDAPRRRTTSLTGCCATLRFAIEPGETVAIVGHTGAGKTTIISLLMRFYDVQKGAVRIDGVDVKEMDLAELRRRFGVVLQDPFLFTGTWRATSAGDRVDHRRGHRTGRRRSEPRGLHSRAAQWIQGRGPRARHHAFHRPETADLVCARAGARSEDSDSG